MQRRKIRRRRDLSATYVCKCLNVCIYFYMPVDHRHLGPDSLCSIEAPNDAPFPDYIYIYIYTDIDIEPVCVRASVNLSQRHHVRHRAAAAAAASQKVPGQLPLRRLRLRGRGPRDHVGGRLQLQHVLQEGLPLARAPDQAPDRRQGRGQARALLLCLQAARLPVLRQLRNHRHGRLGYVPSGGGNQREFCAGHICMRRMVSWTMLSRAKLSLFLLRRDL
ncbi:uncharacterized protein P884DRAFT_24547 [Thermothelomyces heterothallicus CBS 202.75]|uniref:uncharacterized protein n=1 Tax=Thermothelomyces heterothallicus CBS 202.75 TaxID=1149848 RepID=UPI0037422917